MPFWGYLLFVTGILRTGVSGFTNNFVEIDLRYGIVKGYSPYITFVQTPTPTRDRTCAAQAVIRMDFSGPYKGAKFLLDYGESPRLWTLDVSDSPTGDGFGGDNGTSSNNAEAQIHNRQLRVYGNSLPGYMEASINGGNLLKVVDNFVKKGAKVSVDISDERIEWVQGRKRDYMESRHLFTLSGQKTEFGPVESNVYVGFNRVVRGKYRSGSGLCRVTISLYQPGQDCERGTHTCHKDAVCLNSRRSYQCRCKTGFYGNGKICVDDDECEFENGGCVHSCQNSPGNYSCSCLSGFELDKDGHDCKDKNECFENKGGCQQQCQNTIGSYQCKCHAGYSLEENGRNCKLGTYCRQHLGCAHHCKTTPQAGTICACRDGYRIHKNGKDCVQTCQVGNGGCQHKCQDTPDGPVCACAAKYVLREDQKTCIDVDECLSNNGQCSHQCINTRGSYECVCPAGYKVNIDQKSCTDIDECALNNTCDHVCVNTPGSFKCNCRHGYQMYGSTHCADIDECSINNGDCAHSCSNRLGGYDCVCRSGFKLHPNKKDCIESSKCIPLSNPSRATLSCRNVAGGEQQCSLACNRNARFTSGVANQITYMCGPSTSYKWNFERNNSTLPSCSELTAPPGYKRKARFLFVTDKCQFKRSATEILRASLANILNKQKKFKCRKKCQVTSIDIKCGSRRRKFSRKVQGNGKSLVTAEFELLMNSRKPSGSCDIACVGKRTKRKLKKAFKTLKRAIRKGDLPIGFAGTPLDIIKKSFRPEKAIPASCSPGTVNVNQVCVGCSIGTYFDADEGGCRPCPGGTYQDTEGQMSCKDCPNRRVSGGRVGAASATECADLCEPGFYSKSGSKPCVPCAQGYYQPDYGRTTCTPCGHGMRTRGPAAAEFKACSARATCQAGHFYNATVHQCQICPRGSYQPRSGHNYCIACPGSTTTDTPGSTSSDNCKNRLCGGYQGRYQGVIETPNYPGDYPIDIRCTWKIKPDKRRRILVIIPEIYLREDDKCGDVLVMRKSKSPYSLTTFETCKSKDQPIAFTARSKKLWIQFKSDGNNTARGFSIPFVTYNEEYQTLIEDIVRDGRLYNSYQHQQIFKDRKLLNALLEVIAQPYNYLKYANVSHTMFPQSFFRLLTPKVRRFFNT
ncbi:signal peptide, CUB and EGF-like domain-containing protein 1 isoform X2 [Haliotis cracherodii]|uniref:signal peptide, CUB and EGF-like domain-containing protein 1 isoform X2 n=1 Tax=Haliotis cracherodii TaxID=6455 RepID=UPI0039E8809E